MILPNIGALTVVCWIMCVRNAESQAYAPAPTFGYRFRINESNIELNTIVEVACSTTWNAPYPITLSVGRLESPSQTPETSEAWVTSDVINHSDVKYFTIPATAKFEGKIVCWYKSTKTHLKNPYSELSSPITLVVSALPHPKVTVQPKLFRKGENYNVYCDSGDILATNFTLSLYYRLLPVTPGTNWTLAGSVFLTNVTSIVLRQTNVVVPIEFACSMEMLYNGKLLHSSLSNSEQAIPEELPVRLWEQERGESCLGYLDITLKGKWEPVCQKEIDTTADSSAAAATAEVVCRELGCGHVLKWERLLDNRRQFTQTVGGIRCTGEEKKIKDCSVEEIDVCRQRGTLYIVCSDALPRPKLSVDRYGPDPKLYVTDKENMKIFCSIHSAYLKSDDYGYFEFRKDGAYLTQRPNMPGYPAFFTEDAPVPQGEYECVFHLVSSKIKPVSQPSNSVFIYIYIPPDPVPIVTGVLTTAVGLAVLVYICVYRTAAKEEQPDECPQTSSENPYAGHSSQQLEA
ncbi:uncharacterized protein si:dkey-195m11.11 [Carassius gibelio]|uniref:uncharacterized protein si:dkey-195m11.11 n=1 Tax=Carassius gibelio TaxID=101364 RepID=UPI002278B18D|nr:uncharacterized protein si:dkey-195m11.11 [Carassius gibelio]